MILLCVIYIRRVTFAVAVVRRGLLLQGIFRSKIGWTITVHGLGRRIIGRIFGGWLMAFRGA